MKRILLSMAALALMASGMTSASASHPTMLCLDIGEDQHYPVSNDDIVDSMVAFPGMTDADHPPQHEGCVTARDEPSQVWSDTQVDFEITGTADPDSSDSPERPDATCTVPEGNNHCRVDAFTSGGGEQLIRAWIDIDKNDGTIDGVDMTEGYNEDENAGSYAEPDLTDVALWTWTHGDPPPSPCGSDEVCWGRVSIDHDGRDNRFSGRITREHGSCGTGSVTLRKKRPGPDRVVAEALISGSSWEVVLERRIRGRFYAALSETKTHSVYTDWPEYPCVGDRSPVLRLN